MKKLAIILAVGAAGLVNVKPANAQISLGLNLHFGNVGAHVVVAPPVQAVSYSSYDNDDDFYYLPDVEAYYDVAQQCYYYNDGDRWMHATYLPGRRDYDWRSARRFEVHARRPYMNHDEYRNRFGGFDRRYNGFDNRYADRGGFDRRDDNRGWNSDNRGGFDRRDDNRGWNGGNRGGFDHRDDNRGQQYNEQNRGNYGQPQNNQYQNGGQQNQGRGSYGQQQGQGNPYQNGGQQGGGRGNYGQPAGQNGQQGQDRGGNRGEEHFAANKMGMMRPNRF